jgi:ABC-2 type transport system ATP-binding protein
MAAVEIQDLIKKYENTTALAGISIGIESNRIFGFVGPDGAGKTSLFRILCGILTPTGGKVKVLGIDVLKYPERLKQELGYMSQKFALYSDLTVRENLDFFTDLFKTPVSGLNHRRNELLKFAGLTQFQDRLAGNLSGGMKQKLALCCTLIHTPKILVLDEPTTGVDPVSRQEFWEMLLPLPKQGTTVVVSTAYMDEAAKCDTVALMNLGGILKTGTPAALKDTLRGRIFEVRGERLALVKDYLSGVNWLEEVQVFGDRLHVQVKAEIAELDRQNKLETILNQNGFPVIIAPVEPSLEDVFVDLMAV